MEFVQKENYTLYDLVALVARLRGENGCAWDREQTHASIRRNVLEEAYETAHAIDSGDTENLREELGDLLMQVLLHADMEEEAGNFDLDDVADTACKKLVFRHPHVFGSKQIDDSAGVLRTWDEQKKLEKGQRSVTDTLKGVAETLPALWRAEKIQKKAGEAAPDGVTALHAAVGALEEQRRDAESVIGDLLFAAVAAAREAGVDPEMALHAACERFIRAYAEKENDDN